MICLHLVRETSSSWLALWHALYRAHSLHFMWFYRGDESNKGQTCHTPSHIRQSTQLWALQAVSISAGCCQLSWPVGGEHLLQYFRSIFFFFSGELLYCKRRAVIHPFYRAFSASPLIVFYLIESFWSKSTDKNRRPTEKNKLKLFIFQIFLCCTSTILHIFWPPNSISKFI